MDNDGVLDKEATSYNDIFDAFRLALKFYHFRDSSEYDWYQNIKIQRIFQLITYHAVIIFLMEFKLLWQLRNVIVKNGKGRDYKN